MHGTLRQTPRAPSLCLRCTWRLLNAERSAARTPSLAARCLSTSSARGQFATAAAAASDPNEQQTGADTAEPPQHARGNPFASNGGAIQWGAGRANRTGLGTEEQRQREQMLRQQAPPPPQQRTAPRRQSNTQNAAPQRERPRIRYTQGQHGNDTGSPAARPRQLGNGQDRAPREGFRIRYTEGQSHGSLGTPAEMRRQPTRPVAERIETRPSRPTAWRPESQPRNAIDYALRDDSTRRSADQNGRPRMAMTREWVHLRGRTNQDGTQDTQHDRQPRTEQSAPAPGFSPAQLGRSGGAAQPQDQARSRSAKSAPRRRDQEPLPSRERRAARMRRDFEAEEDVMSDAALERIERHRQRKKEKEARSKDKGNAVPVVLPEFISVATLAGALKVRLEDFVSKLRELGFEDVTNDHVIDAETAGLVAGEFGFEPILPQQGSGEDLVAQPEPDDKSFLLNRPPVVTIMGHVDHGKTTLLDWLRKSSVAASEHGGITQHIGAFTVPMPSGRVITFLDTPGHAAFLAMRARGANVTDIVILVVAADDSVKPQTIEAIKHAKDAKVPVIVAISKVDKPEADPQRVKQDLARHGIEVEDFGGDVQTVEVSGKTGQGMAELEESSIALADILDLRAPTDGPVEGWVLESSSGKAGKTATVLVRRGTLVPGSMLVAGTTWTRVRSLRDEHGNALDSAGPATPVLVDGWRDQPTAGDEALQASSEQRAKEAIDFRLARQQNEKMAQDVSSANQSRVASAAVEAAARAAEQSGEVSDAADYVGAQRARETSSGVPELPLILRADVSGSVDALDAYVQSIPSPMLRPNILRSLVGQVTSSDISLAQATGGAVVAFNIETPGAMALAAERAGVKIIEGNVIYKVIEEVKGLMEERLPELVTTKVLGEATVLEVFEIGLGGRRKLPVAGVSISNGVLKKGMRVRVMRGGRADDGLTSDLGGGRRGARKAADTQPERVVHDGLVGSLKSHKKDVPEMRKGSECGLSFEGGFAAFESGDRVQCYEEVRERRRL